MIDVLGQSCYDCFGECFRRKGYLDHKISHDPLIPDSSSVLPVGTARQMRSTCLEQCPIACPDNTIDRMEKKCKKHCRKGITFGSIKNVTILNNIFVDSFIVYLRKLLK